MNIFSKALEKVVGYKDKPKYIRYLIPIVTIVPTVFIFAWTAQDSYQPSLDVDFYSINSPQQLYTPSKLIAHQV